MFIFVLKICLPAIRQSNNVINNVAVSNIDRTTSINNSYDIRRYIRIDFASSFSMTLDKRYEINPVVQQIIGDSNLSANCVFLIPCKSLLVAYQYICFEDVFSRSPSEH